MQGRKFFVRLTILNQYFYPDISATGQLMTELAQNLVEHGFEVTAVSARGCYNGGSLPRHDRYKGVLIERAWATSFGKKRSIGRLSDYLTFYLSSFVKLMILPRQDIVMALTTPPLIGLVAMLVGKLRGMRVVALMEDLYPDVAVALGALPASGRMTRVMDWLTRIMLSRSDRIIVLSDCMLERIVEKMGPQIRSRIDVIHNWADGEQIMPVEEGKQRFFESCQLEQLTDKFVVLFSGNMGRVNEFMTVMEAARLLRERSDIAFVFIGEGARASEIKGFTTDHRLPNVFMLPYQPREQLSQSLSSGDALLITLSEGLAGLSVPSKTYSSLAAGRPLLFVGDQNSSVARLIQSHECGASVAAGECRGLADVISAWATDRAASAELGAAARSLFERRFDRPVAVNGYLASLRKCFDGAGEAHDHSTKETIPIKTAKAKGSIL
jgi:colanic acid biosynthesis glycosyl transferase WcaI